MTFRAILSHALESIDGALGAMFLDSQGEAVEVVTSEYGRYDMQVVGAYQGIYLDHLRRICSSLDHGDPVRFKIEWDTANQYNWVLEDGYYFVVIVEKRCPESRVWQQMELTRAKLLKEF